MYHESVIVNTIEALLVVIIHFRMSYVYLSTVLSR